MTANDPTLSRVASPQPALCRELARARLARCIVPPQGFHVSELAGGALFRRRIARADATGRSRSCWLA